MNIFYLSNDVEQAARWHVSRHIVKMVLEYSQLLSFAHRILDGEHVMQKVWNYDLDDWRRKPSGEIKLYDHWKHPHKHMESQLYLVNKPHSKHPSTLWVMESASNYRWLYNLLIAVGEEYTYRYGKVHSSFLNSHMHVWLYDPPANIPNGPWTPPTPAMHDMYITPNNNLTSYREYYKYGKIHLAEWIRRKPPKWYLIEGSQVIESESTLGYPKYTVINPLIQMETTPTGRQRGIRHA